MIWRLEMSIFSEERLEVEKSTAKMICVAFIYSL